MEKKKQLILIAVLVCLFSVLFAGCGDDKYVQTVKNGSLDMAKGVPIGKAFDQFFNNGKWESFVSDNNERIVEFNGECRWNNNPATCCIQFRILNNSRFEVCYLDINGVSMNWLDGSSILNKVLYQYRAK